MLILQLSNRHDRRGFDCGNSDLNNWFAEVANQHKKKLVSATFVATESDLGTEVLGFYSINLVELLNGDLPPGGIKSGSRYGYPLFDSDGWR